ncbi:MAG: DNA cytosine methyltransferase [Candidatus Poribacteria bacterium]|nr:DNA cytosine methyltransferase [Candidatus Poribacteria bacterium]
MTLNIFDFFSGCGGASKGFEIAGLTPVFALDFDKGAASTFKANFSNVVFSESDITSFNTTELDKLFFSSDKTLFSGCAPCQPFTKQKTIKPDSKNDSRRSLLSRFGELVEKYRPDYVFVENVPGIQCVEENSALKHFITLLETLKYHKAVGIVESQKYGVPQRRRRLILLACKFADIDLPQPTHGPAIGKPYSTVRDWIAHLPPIEAGEVHPTIPNHRAANLSRLNLQRIKATPPEGSRINWPEELQLTCHKKNGYSGHTDVYGRMRWDNPATCLTTRCISLSNGRYGHPEQHRAISVREAAILQTFPDDFKFFGSLHSQARQIGNAIPVLLAQILGRHFLDHMELHAN